MKRLLAATTMAGALGGCFIFNCVARGAQVRTRTGLRTIELFGIGDEILCIDPESGESVSAFITHVRSAMRECVSLAFGGTELVLTADHPVYDPDAKEYAYAGDWAVGRRLRLLAVGVEGLSVVQVERVSTFAGVHEVLDLTVDHPLHNFVANGVLVHNKEPIEDCSFQGSAERVRQYEPCECPDGTEGTVDCSSGFFGVCFGCLDAGESDAGSEDAGIPDAGRFEEDGGTADGGD